MVNKQWIRKAIPESHRGKLEKWAKEHHFMDVNGDINLRKAMSYAKNDNSNYKNYLKCRHQSITIAITITTITARTITHTGMPNTCFSRAFLTLPIMDEETGTDSEVFPDVGFPKMELREVKTEFPS